MLVALFIIYLVLFSWIVTKIRFFNINGISKTLLVTIFIVKITIAIFFGWVSANGIGGFVSNDSWDFHTRSVETTNLLFKSPQQYVTHYFQDRYNNHGFSSLFESENSYWNTLKDKTYIYFISIINCFTFGNYYINAVFFSFLMLFGWIALLKVNLNYFSKTNKHLVLACTFLMPSFLFWNNTLSKDAIVFALIAIILYFITTRVSVKKFDFKSIIIILFSSILLFVFKNYIFIILAPALIFYSWASLFSKKTLQKFIIFYSFLILLFFGLQFIDVKFNFAAYIQNKQQAFLSLETGGSTIQVNPIEPNSLGLIKQIPQSIYLAGFTPTLSQIKGASMLLSFLEITIFWIGVLSFIIIFIIKKMNCTPYGLFVFAFFIGLLLAIGFTNNNIGAIVRYRSTLYPFCIPFIFIPIFKFIFSNKIKSSNYI